MSAEESCMNTGVSSSGSGTCNFFIENSAERFIEDLLNSDGIGLNLPPMVGCAFIGNKNEVSGFCRNHSVNIRRFRISDFGFRILDLARTDFGLRISDFGMRIVLRRISNNEHRFLILEVEIQLTTKVREGKSIR
jgi:hypothetical protein